MEKDFSTFYDGREGKYYLFLRCSNGMFNWCYKLPLTELECCLINRMLGNGTISDLLNTLIGGKNEKERRYKREKNKKR